MVALKELKGRALEVPKFWDNLLKDFLNSSEGIELESRLLAIDRQSQLYNKRGALTPLKLVFPRKVKAVLLVNEPITKDYRLPFIQNNGDFSPKSLKAMSTWVNSFQESIAEKHEGTNYVHIKRNMQQSSYNSSYAIEQWSRVRKMLDYTGTSDISPFQTYNWYKQGLLILNINFTGSPIQSEHGHYGIWRKLLVAIIQRLQEMHKNMIFVSYNSAIVSQLSPHFDVKATGANAFVAECGNLGTSLVKINTLIKSIHRTKKMINYLC